MKKKTGKKSPAQVHLADDVVWADLDGREKLVVDIARKRYYIFNRLSWEILCLLGERLDKETIARKICAKYSPGLEARQIHKIIRYLLKQKLSPQD